MDNSTTVNNSGKFQDFIDVSSIICHSSENSKTGLINELIDLAVANNCNLDPEEVREKVFAREELFSTIIAPGLAMPHARIDGLERIVVVLATSVEGVAFAGAEGNELAHVVVLLLSPADNPGSHLHVVSALAHEFCDSNKVQELAKLPDAAAVLKYLGIVPMRLSEYLKVGDLASDIGPVVLPTDSLEFALRKFAEAKTAQLPVIDAAGAVLGVLTLKDVLAYNLPAGLLDKDDLSEIYDFRPYASMLSRGGDITVDMIMRRECQKACEDMPAVQLLKVFVKSPADELLVLDKEGRLRGVVRMREFCAKLLWE